MITTRIQYRLHVLVFITATLLLSTSCVTDSSRNGGSVKPDLSYKEKYEILSKEYRTLMKEYEKISKHGSADQRELENKVTQLNAGLMEKDKEIEKLSGQVSTLQKKLDETIQEVVRAKSKLRSLESRAETATSIAETEITLKALRAQHPAGDANPDLNQAEQLLAMSSQEFKKENYSGALYLINQVKDHISRAQANNEGGEVTQALLGEVPFAKPLKLKVTKKSNVREGPGLDFKVVAVVKPSTPLVGYSFKGQWLRIKGDNGVGGWISQDLVKNR